MRPAQQPCPPGVIRGLEPGYSAVAARAADGPDLYYKGDEHWNGRGALIATTELVDVLQPGLFDPSAYRFVPRGEVRPDNLARFQGETRTEVADAVVVERPSVELVESDRARSTPGAQIVHQRRTGTSLVSERVLVVHDSFGVALQPLVSPWLADVTWFSIIGGSFDASLLSQALSEADTVVVVMVERNLRLRAGALATAARTAFAP